MPRNATGLKKHWWSSPFFCKYCCYPIDTSFFHDSSDCTRKNEDMKSKVFNFLGQIVKSWLIGKNCQITDLSFDELAAVWTIDNNCCCHFQSKYQNINQLLSFETCLIQDIVICLVAREITALSFWSQTW